MKQFSLLSLLLIISFTSFAQIGGLSGSKLGSLTVDVVDDKKIEFEPSFFHARSSKYWDNSSDLQNIYSTSDSLKVVTGMGFRFSYGLWDKLELGMSISTDLSAAALGLRYVILQKEKYGFALISGMNFPLGNRTIDQTIRATGNIPQMGLGLVGSYSFSENLSIDFTGQYAHFLEETNDKDRGGVHLNSDLGYYVFNHQLQLIGGLGYHYIKNNVGSHQVLTVYPGITVETSRNFIIVISVPFDVYGQQENKNLGFNFALTLTFD
ncbi:MAG: hypothetical protein DSY76_09270 [Bacteroidetes bacterium]|nr:MAG: hypothetical protein DSY76_09270 [Bacteroidota bacterium]